MARLRHPGRHLHLAGTPYDPRAIESFSREYSPFCAGFTGNPGTIASGTPGAKSNVIWTPSTNPIYDPFFMLTAGSPNVRIPWDGFYDFYFIWDIGDNVAVNESIACFMQTAPASDSGYTSPVFTTLPGQITKVCTTGANTLDVDFLCLYRGNELHAGDLVRFQVQVWGTQALTATTVVQAEFRWVRPIPVKTK